MMMAKLQRIQIFIVRFSNKGFCGEFKDAFIHSFVHLFMYVDKVKVT